MSPAMLVLFLPACRWPCHFLAVLLSALLTHLSVFYTYKNVFVRESLNGVSAVTYFLAANCFYALDIAAEDLGQPARLTT